LIYEELCHGFADRTYHAPSAHRGFSCCAALGVVPQETTLFSGTVYDNLAMASPHAGFDEIVATATGTA